MRPNYFIFMGYFKKWDETSKANPHTLYIWIPFPQILVPPMFSKFWKFWMGLNERYELGYAYLYIYKWFTTFIKNETQVTAQQTKHVCSFILGLVFYWGIILQIFFRYINISSVLLIPYSNVRDMHVQTPIQIYAYYINTCTATVVPTAHSTWANANR